MATLRFILSARYLIMGVLLLALPGFSCSSSTRKSDRSGLDLAIETYIAGDLSVCIEKLEALTREEQSREMLIETYLYLGRAYLETKQYNRAIDSFRVGKVHDGGEVFDAYLERLALLTTGSPDVVASSMRINRGQLAVLLDGMFFENSNSSTPNQPAAADEHLATSAKLGIVPVLPDGGFHAAVPVTRASFFAAVARLANTLGLRGGAAVFFDGGFGWSLTGDQQQGPAFVSGRDAVKILEKVKVAQENNGG